MPKLSCPCHCRLLQDDLDHRAQPILCIVELPINNSSRSSATNQQQLLQQQRKAGSTLWVASAAAPAAAAADASGSVIGLCLLDVASGQCHVGSFSTAADASRAALATALLMHDPVECIALRNNLHGATSTLVTRHCELKGCSAAGAAITSSSSGSGAARKHVPGLSWLPASAAAAVLGGPMQLLAEHLPPEAAQKLQELLAGAGSKAAAAAGAGALAVAVKQLQRCSLAGDVLPTLQLAGLEGMARPAAAQGPGRARCHSSRVWYWHNAVVYCRTRGVHAAGDIQQSALHVLHGLLQNCYSTVSPNTSAEETVLRPCG
jgi:hypothetical protein